MRAKKWPVDSELRLEDTSYGKTFVRISGPVGAPPLVLLHGGGGNSLQWMPNIEALSKSYRAYAVDNIYDYGRSIYTQIIKHPDDFANWLDELFSVLELGNNINLMGLAYGGWITIQYALRLPERLNEIAPQIKTEVIPSAGHDLTIVQAKMVNTKVLEFLKSL